MSPHVIACLLCITSIIVLFSPSQLSLVLEKGHLLASNGVSSQATDIPNRV